MKRGRTVIILQHFAGMALGSVAVLFIFILMSWKGPAATPQLSAGIGRNLAEAYSAVPSENYVGLARIAAARALDGNAQIQFAYNIEEACGIERMFSSDEKINAETVSLGLKGNDEGKRSNIYILKMNYETWIDFCNNNDIEKYYGSDDGFLLTASRPVRRSLKEGGARPSYVAISR